MPSRHNRSTKSPPALATDSTSDAPRCTLRPDVHEQLLRWSEENYSAQAIIDGLKERFGWAPHRNTVYKEARRHAPQGDEWTLATEGYDADAAASVLEELKAVFTQSGGRRRSFTKREAWWIARLRSIRSDLNPGDAFQLARLHATAEAHGEQLSAWMDLEQVAEALLVAKLGHPQLFTSKETRR